MADETNTPESDATDDQGPAEQPDGGATAEPPTDPGPESNQDGEQGDRPNGSESTDDRDAELARLAADVRARRAENAQVTGMLIGHWPDRDVNLGPIDGDTAMRILVAHKLREHGVFEDDMWLTSAARSIWISLDVQSALAFSWRPDWKVPETDRMSVDPPASSGTAA